MQHLTGSAAGAGRPVVVEVVAVAGCAALLVGRGNSLMTEFRSPHFLHGLGAVAALRAASCELRRRLLGVGGPEWHARDG